MCRIWGVVAEIAKWQHNRGELASLYSWRTASGREVDLVWECGGKPWPLEVKSAATIKPFMAAHIKAFRDLFPDSGDGFLIHLGEKRLALDANIWALPFSALTAL